jgi:hypothetical protein
MNKQGHFKPKATLCATSVFAARPNIAAAVVEGVRPVVGSTPSIPSFLMSSHFQSIGTDFYWVRPVQYRFDHLSKIVREPFWGVRRGATERPNGVKLCRHVKES